MTYRCDREPADDGHPTPPPSDAYLDAWMARWNRKLVPADDDLPGDLARLLKEI